MSNITIVTMLDAIQDYRNTVGFIEDDRDAAVKELLGEDLLAAMQQLVQEYNDKADEARRYEAELTEQVKVLVEMEGVSVKGQYLSAIFAKPRTTWDSKGLEGFMIAHPEIKAFQKVGQATVQIRRV